jgi:hypothetical protein
MKHPVYFEVIFTAKLERCYVRVFFPFICFEQFMCHVAVDVKGMHV